MPKDRLHRSRYAARFCENSRYTECRSSKGLIIVGGWKRHGHLSYRLGCKHSTFLTEDAHAEDICLCISRGDIRPLPLKFELATSIGCSSLSRLRFGSAYRYLLSIIHPIPQGIPEPSRSCSLLSALSPCDSLLVMSKLDASMGADTSSHLLHPQSQCFQRHTYCCVIIHVSLHIS